MGGFVDYRCKHCRLEIEEIPVGHGRNPSPRLALFRCTKCKTVGSTWVGEGAVARCGACYEPGVELLPDDAPRVACPRCGEPGRITPREESWE